VARLRVVLQPDSISDTDAGVIPRCVGDLPTSACAPVTCNTISRCVGDLPGDLRPQGSVPGDRSLCGGIFRRCYANRLPG